MSYFFAHQLPKSGPFSSLDIPPFDTEDPGIYPPTYDPFEHQNRIDWLKNMGFGPCCTNEQVDAVALMGYSYGYRPYAMMITDLYEIVLPLTSGLGYQMIDVDGNTRFVDDEEFKKLAEDFN